MGSAAGIAVCLLGALVYEVHNSSGRYEMLPESNFVFDTATGCFWRYDKDNSLKWKQFVLPVPNRSHSIAEE